MIEKMADERNYNSISEHVSEALRDKVEEDLILRPEVVKKLQKRLEESRSGETELIPHEQVRDEIDS